MSSRRDENGRPGRVWLGRLGWLAAGVVLALAVALGTRWFGGLSGTIGMATGEREMSAEAATLWTCPMHPHLLEEEPGECPICGMTLVPVPPQGSDPIPAKPSAEREVLFYRNPMEPMITSPVPAKDQMGTDYAPVYADQASDETAGGGTVVRLDPVVVQRMNVRSQPVERRDLRRHIRTVGYLEYDQERMVTVTTKYSGWVEKVYASYVGEPVRKGQPLFEIYSPELVQTEQELISARDYAQRLASASEESRWRAEALAEAARTRLSYWDIAPEQIATVEETGEIFRTLQVVSPASGLIMKRMDGLQGMAIRPGMEIFHIADLSHLWLSVEVFEDQMAWIALGTPAEVAFTYFPGESFEGSVRFIEPEFSEKTRTLRVKLGVPNHRGRLRPGMFATVSFRPTAAPSALAIPALAILRTGERNVVVLDLGGGRFAQREVKLGHEGEGWVEVVEGLSEDDRIVTSAQFLIDSEANLQEAIQKLLAVRAAERAAPPGERREP